MLCSPGADDAAGADDYRWIDLTDVLSLVACGGLDRPVERYGFRGEAVDGVLTIDPFPLAGATTLRVRCREDPRAALRERRGRRHGACVGALAGAGGAG